MVAIDVLASLSISIVRVLLMITLAIGIVGQWTWKAMRGRRHVYLIVVQFFVDKVILVH